MVHPPTPHPPRRSHHPDSSRLYSSGPQSPTFFHMGDQLPWKTIFLRLRVRGGGWFWDTSSALHLLCTLFLLLLHQLPLRSSGVEYWRLRTPALWEAIAEFTELSVRLPVCLPHVTPPDSQQLEGTKEGQGTLKMLRSAMNCLGVVKEDFTKQTQEWV